MMVLHKKSILSHVLWQSIPPGSDNTYPDNKERSFIVSQTKLVHHQKYKNYNYENLNVSQENTQ